MKDIGQKVLAVTDKQMAHHHGGHGAGHADHASHHETHTESVLIDGEAVDHDWSTDQHLRAQVDFSTDKGYLDVHGARRLRTWTKLEGDSPVGSDVIHLREEVDWKEGERLIITSSTNSMSQLEDVTIKKVLGAKSLQLEKPLRFRHFSTMHTSPDGLHVVDMVMHIVLFFNQSSCNLTTFLFLRRAAKWHWFPAM